MPNLDHEESGVKRGMVKNSNLFALVSPLTNCYLRELRRMKREKIEKREILTLTSCLCLDL